jgi:hypothetical protein
MEAFQPIRVNPSVIKVTLPGCSLDVSNVANKRVVLVLDVSGSMQSILHWNEKIFDELARQCGQVHLICFSDKFTDYGLVNKLPANYFTGGGTNFYLPLKHLTELKLPAGSVVFFSTDGAVNDWSLGNSGRYMPNLRNKIANEIYDAKLTSNDVQVNVFGITSSSATKELFKISRMGSIEGEYYSVNIQSQLDSLIDDLINHIASQKVTLFGVDYPLNRKPRDIFIKNEDYECPQGNEEVINSYKFDQIGRAIKMNDIAGAREILRSFQQKDILVTVKSLDRKERKSFLASYFDLLSKISRLIRPSS